MKHLYRYTFYLKVQHSRVALIEVSDVQIHSDHSMNHPQVTSLADNWTLWLSLEFKASQLVTGNIQALFRPCANPVSGSGYTQRRNHRCPLFAICGIFNCIFYSFSQRWSSIIVELSAGYSSVPFSRINSRAADANKHVIRQFPTPAVMDDGKTSTEVVHILNVLPIPKSYVWDDHLH